MSLAGPIRSTGPVAISGAMYAGVPPMPVLADENAVDTARPQSISSTSPKSPSITFSGFRSR